SRRAPPAARSAPVQRGGARALSRCRLRADHRAPRLLSGYERTRGRAAARARAMSRRALMLEEMGIAPLWRLRARDAEALPAQAASVARAPAEPGAGQAPASTAGPASDQRREPAAPAPRTPGRALTALSAESEAARARREAILQMDWAALRASVAQCRA